MGRLDRPAVGRMWGAVKAGGGDVLGIVGRRAGLEVVSGREGGVRGCWKRRRPGQAPRLHPAGHTWPFLWPFLEPGHCRPSSRWLNVDWTCKMT